MLESKAIKEDEEKNMNFEKKNQHKNWLAENSELLFIEEGKCLINIFTAEKEIIENKKVIKK